MKKLILFLLLIPSLLMGQSKFAGSGSGFVTSANNPLTGGHGSGYISVKITNPATDNLFASSTKITHIKESKATLIAISLSPFTLTKGFDFIQYVKSKIPINEFDSIAKKYKTLETPSIVEFVPIRVIIGGDSIQEKKYNGDYDFASFRKLIYEPLPASASINIVITDNGTATLADIRDTLCSFWGYSGDPNDNAAKLAFMKQFVVNKIKSDYAQMKGVAASQSTLTVINIQ